jgi:Nickel responsive protein SCO4226-like
LVAPIARTAAERIYILPKYMIERNIPKIGTLPIEDLQVISRKSCGVLRSMGPRIQWVQSYLTMDKMYCLYIAPDEEMIREHAESGGFPADRISMITAIIDPTTAEA